MAVHIFRVRLAGTLLFPEAILSYITFRSTTIYLFKKKKIKIINLYQESVLLNTLLSAGIEKKYKRQVSIHTTYRQ